MRSRPNEWAKYEIRFYFCGLGSEFSIPNNSLFLFLFGRSLRTQFVRKFTKFYLDSSDRDSNIRFCSFFVFF